ncbi:MAG: hypothetical protein HXX09_12830 [Bacteroidetes bacterium]|nr:hypothetical protein [Bacteroidota bacterium]
MKTILIFLIGLIITFSPKNNFAENPRDFCCNSHVKVSITQVSGFYKIKYTFKDHRNNLQNLQFFYSSDITNKDIQKFGIPKSMYSPYNPNNPFTKIKRWYLLKKGLYESKGSILKPNKKAIITYYRPYCKPISDELLKILKRYGESSRENKINIALKFVQDIPYGIPENANYNKERSGLMPPPEILSKMYGDCDSKAILFACILSYMTNINDILFLNYEGHHALTAVRSEIIPGQNFIEYKNSKYVICESSGPARYAIGQDGTDSNTPYKVEQIWF